MNFDIHAYNYIIEINTGLVSILFTDLFCITLTQ